MLRQALEEAERRPLVPPPEPEEPSVDEDDDEEDDDDDYLLEWDQETSSVTDLPQTIWNKLKTCFLVVANVENLWDSPHDTEARMGQEGYRDSTLIVLFWFVVLATSYACERSSFKLLVDRAAPFRLFAVEMVTGVHALILGLTMVIKSCVQPATARLGLGIPVVDVALMALLDTATLLLVFLSGYHVPPTLTVILVQFTLPLTALLTQFVHPDGRFHCCRPPVEPEPQCSDSPTGSPGTYGAIANNNSVPAPPPGQRMPEGTPIPGWGGLSWEHIWGSGIIALACLLALLPAFYSIADPEFFAYADTIPMRTAINTLTYVSSCFPAAASQLYKEHIFVSYKQPVNMAQLNLLLSIFQFIFVSILSPLVFVFQGLGTTVRTGSWMDLYPSSIFSDNFFDGLLCFFRLLPVVDQEDKYPEEASCDFALLLVLLYAFSVIAVGAAVDKIVNAGATKVMFRGISAGIIVAVLTMHAYDMYIPDFSYGAIVDGLNLACLLLLILGSEVYHRVTLQDSTFETTYPAVPNVYEDEY